MLNMVEWPIWPTLLKTCTPLVVQNTLRLCRFSCHTWSLWEDEALTSTWKQGIQLSCLLVASFQWCEFLDRSWRLLVSLYTCSSSCSFHARCTNACSLLGKDMLLGISQNLYHVFASDAERYAKGYLCVLCSMPQQSDWSFETNSCTWAYLDEWGQSTSSSKIHRQPIWNQPAWKHWQRNCKCE